jgi:hypothetical protein
MLALALCALIFTTCNSPMGMGKAIDWEPPVLTLDPKPPTPMYVKLGTRLTGTVTDNVAVDRVILRDSVTGKQLFTAALLPEDRWQIDLVFSEEQNGETILAEVVAYDTVGNSGSQSIASVVLIIDIRPPIVEDIWIQRSSTRIAYLETLVYLTALETSDPNGERSASVDKYQNGAFHINAKISEEETRIESVTLKFFDWRHPDTEMLSLPAADGSSLYTPGWLVSEEQILAAGESHWPGYTADYNNGARYYYRLRIVAIDKSKNESGADADGEIIEDQEYLCLWKTADRPKGIIDPTAVGTAGGNNIVTTKGSSIPVEFFDDDRIEWAYAAFFTKDQWDGTNNIAPGFALAGNDEQKFAALQDRLTASPPLPVYGWKYDRYSDVSEPVVNLTPQGADSKIYYVQTGNSAADYGNFVLVTLVRDIKQAPHDTVYPGEDLGITAYKKYNISLVDENAPLIVFDKTNGCPEENTFPKLNNGKFAVHGYTLRDNQGGQNYVNKFRLAWIPFNISYIKDSAPQGPQEAILDVREVLRKATPTDADFPPGVQWWDLSAAVASQNDIDTIGGGTFRKQVFTKQFDVLGGADDIKPAYSNFYYNGKLENTTKLFVFYAEDNMGNVVFTQFNLLGNNTPPDLAVYEITDKIIMAVDPPKDKSSPSYKADLAAYNSAHYSDLRNVSMSGSRLLLTDQDRTESYRAYPRGSSIKFWVMAEKEGDLAIKNIKMEDITYKVPDGAPYPSLGCFNLTDRALSYIEFFPDADQRIFMFTATDSLGNEAKVQRTIAATNAATLTRIETTKQNGVYPAGETILITANFDGMIQLQSNTNGTRPKLNVRYRIAGEAANRYHTKSIECKPVTPPVSALEFEFTVPADAAGKLETLFYDMPSYTNVPDPSQVPYEPVYDRPISLRNKDDILDYERKTTAYTPGNATGFIWRTSSNSLQDSKNIQLDGVAPQITALNIIETKAKYSDGNYYLKSGESTSFALTASKPILTSSVTSPVLHFSIRNENSGTVTGPYTTAFTYRRPSGTSIIVFTLDVNSANVPADGRLVNISMAGGAVTDTVGNPVVASTVSAASFDTMLSSALGSGKYVNFDRTPPPKPVTTLSGTSIGSTPATALIYNASPYMDIPNPSTTVEPYGVTRQYSLDGGLKWIDFPAAEPGWTTVNTSPINTLNFINGLWNLRTRYIDRAGNESPTTDQAININSVFPKLIGVNVQQPPGVYIEGDRLDFTLDFDDIVTGNSGITITLRDTTNTSSTTLTASAVTNSRTVTFTWNLTANTFDMLNGLRIASIAAGNLTDRFGNSAPSASCTGTSVTVGNSVSYNFSNIKVSTITPVVSSRTPVNAQGRSGDVRTSVSGNNKTITLVFSKPMQRGNGTITIRPHGTYAIPAVFENEGYYESNGTRVDGFYDVFNRIDNNADKITLIGSNSMYEPAVNNNTGLSAGPYLKTTHGLTRGAGYSGNYNNVNMGVNAPGPNTTVGIIQSGDYYMVPDVAAKWVLRYDIPDIFAASGIANDIRGVLNRAKFRWQETSVTNTANVTISADKLTVTITLPEPLQPGLQWDLSYPAGTFTDEAGHSAAAEAGYWFWSNGAQKPVIRADRKSYDARAARAGGWNVSIRDIENSMTIYSAAGYAGNIGDYNNISYRITSETPQASIFYATREGKNFTVGSGGNQVPIGSITGLWTGTVTTQTLPNITQENAITWNGPKTTALYTVGHRAGAWIRPNLIFRFGNDADTYNLIMENGITLPRYVGGFGYYDYWGGWTGPDGVWSTFYVPDTWGDWKEDWEAEWLYYGFRSHNKDATFNELNSNTLVNGGTQAYAGSFGYSDLEASKNYIIAEARVDHANAAYSSATDTSPKGFEGVFRTVVAFHQAGLDDADLDYGPHFGYDYRDPTPRGLKTVTNKRRPMLLSGSNVSYGLPTISGFPLRFNVFDKDSRYIKVLYRDGKHFYWVSTEMVSQFYLSIITKGRGYGEDSTQGDKGELTGGYGDLSYSLNLAAWD